MSALSGGAAGILGLTGLYGFIFYFIASLALSVSIRSISNFIDILNKLSIMDCR